MNELNVYSYTAHITYRLRKVLLSIKDRMSACGGASGCRYQFLFDLTHPPNPCMKCKMNFEIDKHTAKNTPENCFCQTVSH